jgi:hypothetical protein
MTAILFAPTSERMTSNSVFSSAGGGSGSGRSGGGDGDRSSGGDAETVFESFDELGELEDGEFLNVGDELFHFLRYFHVSLFSHCMTSI